MYACALYIYIYIYIIYTICTTYIHIGQDAEDLQGGQHDPEGGGGQMYVCIYIYVYLNVCIYIYIYMYTYYIIGQVLGRRRRHGGEGCPVPGPVIIISCYTILSCGFEYMYIYIYIYIHMYVYKHTKLFIYTISKLQN